MWHQDPAIKTEMLQAFSAVYLTDGASEHAEALAANEVAHNLMHLVRHCDAAEVRCKCCMLRICVRVSTVVRVNEVHCWEVNWSERNNMLYSIFCFLSVLTFEILMH